MLVHAPCVFLCMLGLEYDFFLCLHYSLSLLVPPDAPAHQVKVVPDNVMSTSFRLTWCSPPVETSNGPITAYILEYSESSGEAPPCSISLSGVDEEHTVTGLKPHTEYYMKVAAVNAAGRGPFCEQVLVQTAPDSECCVVYAAMATMHMDWQKCTQSTATCILDNLHHSFHRTSCSSRECAGGSIRRQAVHLCHLVPYPEAVLQQ